MRLHTAACIRTGTTSRPRGVSMSEHSTPAGAHLECCTLFSARKETEGTGQEGAAESSQGRQRHRPRLPRAEASGRARRRRAARGCRPGRGAARPAGPDPGPRAGRRRGAAGSAGGLPPPPCGRHGVRDSLGTLAERQLQVMQPHHSPASRSPEAAAAAGDAAPTPRSPEAAAAAGDAAAVPPRPHAQPAPGAVPAQHSQHGGPRCRPGPDPQRCGQGKGLREPAAGHGPRVPGEPRRLPRWALPPAPAGQKQHRAESGP